MDWPRHSVGSACEEFSIFDADPERAEVMARLGREIVKRQGGEFDISVSRQLEPALAGSDIILSQHSCRRYGRAGA